MKRKSIDFTFGALDISQQGEPVSTLATSMAGEEKPALSTQFVFSNPEGLALLARFVEFEDENAIFAGVNLLNGPANYQRATQAGRMDVARFGENAFSVRIRAFRGNLDGWYNLANVGLSELAGLSKVPATVEKLKSIGASSIGTAEELLGVSNQTKSQLAMVFPKDDLRSLVALWGVTRINALTFKFGLPEFEAQ